MDARTTHLYQESMKLMDVSFAMTQRGVMLDTELQAAKARDLANKAAEAHAQFMEQATKALPHLPASYWEAPVGKWWLNKAKGGVKDLFYGKLEIECRHFSKDTGEASLNKSALKSIMGDQPEPARSLAKTVLAFNTWEKLRQMVAGMPSMNDVVHPLWSAGLKVTRRWGSSPNLQNIPYDIKEDGIVTRPGHRDMFIARPGMWLVGADYSQLELRILALLTGDEILLDAYATGKDVHDMNARDLFGKPDFTKKDRRLAKNQVYGMNYGAAWQTVYLNLLPEFPDLDPRLVEYLYNKWFEIHGWITAWQDKQFHAGKTQGYVEEPINQHRFYFYSYLVKPTYCYNFPIQGMAGALMNRAVCAIFDELRPEDGEHVLMNVHDELVLEGPDPNRLAGLLKKHMEQEVTIGDHTMFFPVDPWKGKNWGQTEEMKDV